MSFAVLVRTKSVANLREHWSTKAKRSRAERAAVRVSWLMARRPVISVPCVVTLCRVAPRALDSDNLARSMKAIRDELAAIIGVDDGDDRVTWLYEQRRGPARHYAVEVRWESPAAYAEREIERLRALAGGVA